MQASIEETKSIDSDNSPVKVDWVQNMQFVGTDEKNHAVVMDTHPESGGEDSGPTPSRLLLMAIAGCTAMDIVSILVKSKQALTALVVTSRGVRNDNYPKYYKEIHLFYHVKGRNLEKSRVERAIRLSEEKYCSVGAVVSGKAKIFIQYSIEEEK